MARPKKAESIRRTNLLTSVNSLNKKIIKNLLLGAVDHPATLISRQHSLSAENHRNGSSETINRHQVIYALSDFLIMILSWLVKQSLRAFLFQEVQL